MKMLTKRQAAFTLVEILVVVGIIALLAGIAVPASLRIKGHASAVVCAGKMRDIGVATSRYMGEHNGRFPELAGARESREEDVPVMDNVLDEYLEDEFAFQCPSDHEGIFEKTGSSYFWNSLINGQMMGKMDLLGLTTKETGIPVASDKENFHKHVGSEVNILYADGHVAKEIQFVVAQ